MAAHYTKKQVELLNSLDIVKSARHNRITFTYEFRCILYSEWELNPCVNTIRECSIAHGFPLELRGSRSFSLINDTFKKHGKPTNGKYDTLAKWKSNTEVEIKNLLDSGYFCKGRNGIKFTDEFKEYIRSKYPQQSIEDSIQEVGLDPTVVGYQRIYNLKQVFDGPCKPKQSTIYDKQTIERYKQHPYVDYISKKQIRFKPNFYNELSLLVNDFHINDLLEAYLIEPTLLNYNQKHTLIYKLRYWEKKRVKKLASSDELIAIQYNHMKLLDKLVSDGFKEIGKHIKAMPCKDKKKLFKVISKLPEDPTRQYSIRYILSLINVSKTHYYGVLKDDDYGKRERIQNKSDEKGIECIKATMEYKGFDKGIKQIYMMMKQVTGVQFGINKIRRLMKKGNLSCNIRKPNNSRRSAQRLLKQNCKNNLLKRRFRLFKPNEVTLTDVTYLTYGGGKRAYGSAALDPVTGKLKAFNISSNNDLSLVEKTLVTLQNDNIEANGIFHSDQGTLYLNQLFQQKVKDMNLQQSMSKRGNCWDNAPQESFFGHFKDECDISEFNTIEELQELVNEYVYYYNHERHIWSRNKMTPIEYESYLLNLSEEEYKKHIDKEQQAYIEMKIKAEEEAILRATTLGV